MTGRSLENDALQLIIEANGWVRPKNITTETFELTKTKNASPNNKRNESNT